jgi:hypothetical protein
VDSQTIPSRFAGSGLHVTGGVTSDAARHEPCQPDAVAMAAPASLPVGWICRLCEGPSRLREPNADAVIRSASRNPLTAPPPATTGQVPRFRRNRLGGCGGKGCQPAMTRTHSRAWTLSVMPGNSRRNSIAADNSPCCSNVARIAAASASVTTNMQGAW